MQNSSKNHANTVSPDRHVLWELSYGSNGAGLIFQADHHTLSHNMPHPYLGANIAYNRQRGLLQITGLKKKELKAQSQSAQNTHKEILSEVPGLGTREHCTTWS